MHCMVVLRPVSPDVNIKFKFSLVVPFSLRVFSDNLSFLSLSYDEMIIIFKRWMSVQLSLIAIFKDEDLLFYLK